MNDAKEFDKATSAVNFLKESIDLYWNQTNTEEQLRRDLSVFLSYPKNRGYIFRGNELAPIMERLGKKRLSTLKGFLATNDRG
jgi:hypothetical protein